MNKKYVAYIFSFIILFMISNVYAQDPIKLVVNNKLVICDAQPTIIGERTLVPVRAIFESLGAKVEWDDSTKTVIGVKDNIRIVLQIDNKIAKVNGKDIELDVPAKIINERTMVPVRFIAENLDTTVNWEDSTKTVKINDKFKKENNANTKSIGKLYYDDGTLMYEGELVNNIPNGKGKVIYKNGNIYEGDFLNNALEGKGIYKWTDGNRYEGDFLNNVFEGKGKLYFANGDIFEGNFKNDNASNVGKYTFANGDIYEGLMENWLANGNGKKVYKNGNIYEGVFKDGKLEGKGKLSFVNGDIYEGEFKNDNASNIGNYIFANGDIYEGSMENWLANGNGKKTYKDGTIYEGNFISGELDGIGKLTLKDGTVATGSFKNDTFNGNVIITYKDGSVINSEWQNGIMLKKVILTDNSNNALKTTDFSIQEEVNKLNNQIKEIESKYKIIISDLQDKKSKEIEAEKLDFENRGIIYSSEQIETSSSMVKYLQRQIDMAEEEKVILIQNVEDRKKLLMQ